MTYQIIRCPIYGRRPCAVSRCPLLAAQGRPTCWHHAARPPAPRKEPADADL